MFRGLIRVNHHFFFLDFLVKLRASEKYLDQTGDYISVLMEVITLCTGHSTVSNTDRHTKTCKHLFHLIKRAYNLNLICSAGGIMLFPKCVCCSKWVVYKTIFRRLSFNSNVILTAQSVRDYFWLCLICLLLFSIFHDSLIFNLFWVILSSWAKWNSRHKEDNFEYAKVYITDM